MTNEISQIERSAPLLISQIERSAPLLISQIERIAPLLISHIERSAPLLISQIERSAPLLISQIERSAPLLISQIERSAPLLRFSVVRIAVVRFAAPIDWFVWKPDSIRVAYRIRPLRAWSGKIMTSGILSSPPSTISSSQEDTPALSRHLLKTSIRSLWRGILSELFGHDNGYPSSSSFTVTTDIHAVRHSQ